MNKAKITNKKLLEMKYNFTGIKSRLYFIFQCIFKKQLTIITDTDKFKKIF